MVEQWSSKSYAWVRFLLSLLYKNKSFKYSKGIDNRKIVLTNFIKKHKYYNGLIHCFTGTLIQALEFTKLGFKLGITGWICDKRRNKDLIEVISHPNITIDMIVIETDTPFMPIHPKKESTPSDLWIVLEKIAEIKKLDINYIGEKIYDNSKKFLSN